MPSPQSQLLNFFLRRVVKSRSFEHYPVELLRVAVDAPMRLIPSAPGVVVRSSEVPGIRGEWLEPVDRADRVVLYIHGGGYFCCSPRTHRPLTMALSRVTRSRTFALRYRLAPEHRFPAALEDALAAYRWLLSEGFSPDRIVLGGDSAGGGLTLSTLVVLRDGGEPLPAAAICFSPWTDLAGTGSSMEGNAQRCAMFDARTIRRSARYYLGNVDPRSPLVSPLYADLAGLPPLLLHVSDSEVLLDDSTRLANRAREAGVEVQLRVFEKQPHVWQLFPLLPEARRSLDEVRAFLDRHAPRKRRPKGLEVPYMVP